MRKLLYVALIAAATGSAVLASQGATTNSQETYKIDSAHSSIQFSIRHFLAKTTGSFGTFEGTIHVNPEDVSQNSVIATIQVPSIDTDNAKRDSHLQEAEYFDATEHPSMTFTSTKWVKTGEDRFDVTGSLRMRGASKTVTLEVVRLGVSEGTRGADALSWIASTQIDRTDWGVSAGRPAVGSEVEIQIQIKAIRQ